MGITEIMRTQELRELLRNGEARAIRERAGVSRADAAKSVPIAETTLWRWEVGRTVPKGEKATRYARLLRILAGHSGG